MTPRWPSVLWVVRHGQSAGNVARDLATERGLARIALTGRDVDVPLSVLGREQARALGRWFASSHEDGRPEVVLSIYEMLDPDLIYFFEDREFCSLSLEALVAIGPRHEPWQPKQAGVSPKDVPEAPAPLDTRPLRLRQMPVQIPAWARRSGIRR